MYDVIIIDGDLMDDCVINNIGKMIYVINAPSTVATSSLAIGEDIANICKNNYKKFVFKLNKSKILTRN